MSLRRGRALGASGAVAALAAALGLAASAHAESRINDCGASHSYAPSEWPGFKGCPTGLGLSDRQASTTPGVQWSTTLSLIPLFPGQISGSVVYGSDGLAYIGTSEGIVYAMRPSGTMAWWGNVGARIRASAAVAADGTVYVTSDAGTLTAFDGRTGVVKWTFVGDDWEEIYSAPVIGPDGTIYYGDASGFGTVFAVNPNGTLKWWVSMAGPIYATPVMSRDGRTLYVGNEFLTLRALDLTNRGAFRWVRLDWTGNTATPAVGDDGTIYSVSSRGFVHALNPTTGNTIWTFDTVQPGASRVAIHSSPALLPNGDIAVANVEGRMWVLTPTGAVRWTRTMGGSISATPAVDRNGNIIVATGGTFQTTLGIISAILPGNKALLSIRGSDGALNWSWANTVGLSSSPVISRTGTVLVGTDDAFLFAVGTPLPTASLRPTWPEDDVLISVLRNDNPLVNCNVVPRPAGCTYAPPSVAVKPPACVDPTTRFQKTETPVQAGAFDLLSRVQLVSASCGGNLCGYNADDPASFSETPIAAATQTAMLTAPSDGSPANRNLPSGAVAGCDAVSVPNTCPINPATVVVGSACTFDSDCAAGSRCASVCLNAAGTAVVTNVDTNCSPVLRCGRPYETSDMSCTAGAMPAVSTTTLPAVLPSRTSDYQNYPCHEVRECAEPGAVIASATPTCTRPGGAAISCTANQNPLATANPPPAPATFAASDFFVLSNLQNTKCNLAQVGNAGANKDVGLTGNRNSSGGATQPNNWGVDFRPRFNTSINLVPRPFGSFEPNLDASATWAASGRAFGREIRVFELQGAASLDFCQQSVQASAKLFGQDVAVITSSDRGVDTSAIRGTCEHERAMLLQKLAKLKNAMVDAQQMYTRLYQAGIKPTQAMCQDALGATACPANPTGAQLAAVINYYIDEYDRRWNERNLAFDEERNAILGAISPIKTLVEDGMSGNIRMLDRRARFGIRAVNATVPIGPLSLVLAVEGGGDWGVPGGLEYGVQFYPFGARRPGASATVDVGPAAGINVLLYVGIGIGIGGIAGADVGIGGDVRLIDIGTPIFLRTTISRQAPVTDGRSLLPAWGGSTGVKPGGRIQSYPWQISTSLYSKATMSMLKGEIDVRARVYFTFFSKTWKKRVAKLPGFTPPDVTLVEGTVAGQPLVQTPDLLSAVPQIVFPSFPRVAAYSSGGWGAPNATLSEVDTITSISCYPLVE